ncbi:MAG: hypothetical protein C4547_12095 [Phycisphaerales bacterium]|nr:MAG: hypothetical protein C4547_12095 [Phycisphaerales bacterium]
MFRSSLRPRSHAVAALACIVLPLSAAAAEEAAFYKAYYLEHAERDYAAAALLYESVTQDRTAERELADRAAIRLAACREELTSADFARLMPAQTLVYVEVNRPGEQLNRLIGQLGLLADEQGLTTRKGQRIAISPHLLRELLGLRGVAVAITGFNPLKQEPIGVAVFHPGDVEVIRALIESALPFSAEAVSDIEGFPTYQVEGKAFVTLTSRLVVVGNQPALIQEVVKRASGTSQSPSFADQPNVQPAIARRGDDSLLFFCVNAQQVMPLVNGLLAAGAHDNPELAVARAVLDLNSLESLAGSVGISDDGLGVDVTLRLAEGHKNLVFNLFRMPPLSSETLKCIPNGSAAFVAVSLNPATYSLGGGGSGGSEAAQVVTAMDIGREIFGNIVSVSAFVLPPEGQAGVSGLPIPDAAAVITVNDPAKSEALWAQFLGLASVASGKPALEGQAVTIAGVKARSFAMPDGPTIYLAMVEHDVILSPSQRAVERAIQTRRAGSSILSDAKFQPVRDRITDATTKVVFLHPQRCARIGEQFMSAKDLEEARPWIDAMDDTVVSLVLDHSDTEFHLSALLGNIPDVGDLVSAKIMEERQRAMARQTRRRADAQQRAVMEAAARAGDWERAAQIAEQLHADAPESAEALRDRFERAAVSGNDPAAAASIGEKLCEAMKNDPLAPNNFAWALLTEDKYGGRFGELALKASRRSNEITGHRNWAFVDTLALAEFVTGDVQRAVQLERKAIELAEGRGEPDLSNSLARFEAALGKQAAGGTDDTEHGS